METKEWLEAAVGRKYPERNVSFTYVDIEQPNSPEQQRYSQAIIDEEYFYPLVVFNDEVIAEGNPKLKAIYAKIEEMTAD